MIKRFIYKIIFIDKFFIKTLRRIDIGILKINDIYIADIPKAGSSTIKNIVALKSKRYKLLNKFFKRKPMHSCVTPVINIYDTNNEKKIFFFIKSPEERLYSVYKEKVIENKMALSYSLTKFDKLFSAKKLNLKTKFSKKDSFVDFCNGIVNLKKFLNKTKSDLNTFDKHIISQYDHIINLQRKYPNITQFRLIFYPINHLSYFLDELIEQETNLKINTTKKNKLHFKEDLESSNVIEIMYLKDKILYQKLISSKKGLLELSFESLKNIEN